MGLVSTLGPLLTTLGIILLVVLVLKLLKVGIKWVLRFVINAVIGVALLYLLNLIPFVHIPLNWITTIVTGIFGIPAVVVILIVSFFL